MTIRRVARAVPGLLALLLLFALADRLFAQAENLPPKPDHYVIDQAGVLDNDTLMSLRAQLEGFERETSNQVVVAIYRKLPPHVELEQYCILTANAWAVGLKDKSNGVVLFIFVDDHKIFIATGRGMQGKLTDIVTNRIISNIITPQFHSGNFAAGIQAGVDAIIAATKGEFKGDGSTTHDADQNAPIPGWVIVLIILIVIFIISARNRGSGIGGGGSGGPFIFTGGGWNNSSGGGGGGFSGGGDSGFSGGGGSFDGGGSGGSW